MEPSRRANSSTLANVVVSRQLERWGAVANKGKASEEQGWLQARWSAERSEIVFGCSWCALLVAQGKINISHKSRSFARGDFSKISENAIDVHTRDMIHLKAIELRMGSDVASTEASPQKEHEESSVGVKCEAVETKPKWANPSNAALQRLDSAIRSIAKPVVSKLTERNVQLRLSEMCVGLGGGLEMMLRANIPVKGVNMYDVDGRYDAYYKELGKHRGLHYDVVAHKVHGDLLHRPLTEFAECDVLMAGGPCTPWANTGRKTGLSHPMAAIWLKILEVTVHLGSNGALLAFMFENSENILKRIASEPPFATHVLDYFKKNLPHFVVEVARLDLSDVWAQNRSRCWIRGMRADLLANGSSLTHIPKPLSTLGFERVIVDELLDYSVENIEPSTISGGKGRNIMKFFDRIAKDIAEGVINGGLAIMDADRSEEGVYNQVFGYNALPPLRLNGPEIFVVSIFDWHLPWDSKKVCRFITEEERFAFQGHYPENAKFMKTKAVSYTHLTLPTSV